MKKIVFALLAVFALALTSCEGTKVSILDIDASQLDNTVPKCWEFEYKHVIKELRGEKMYLWCTEYQIVTDLQKDVRGFRTKYNKKADATYKEVYAADKESCDCKNDF